MSDQAKLRMELPVILPDIPDARDQCVKVLVDTLNAREGVTEAHIADGDASTQPQLCIHYDRTLISLARVRELTLAAGAEITSRIGHISARLPSALHARAARTLAARLSNTPGVLEADVSASGSLRLEFDRHAVNFEALTAELQKDGIDISMEELQGNQSPHSPPAKAHAYPEHTAGRRDEDSHDQRRHAHEEKGHSHAQGGLFGERTELVFSLIAGALLAAGWLLELFEASPVWMPVALYILAYVFGGWFTSREAIENLQAKRFEIDSLMLVAAIGAAALGKWAEGALLLFLFSLGHALEHWAMGRARRAIEALAELAPETALVKRCNQTEEVSVNRLARGDVIVVRPNERLAADGIVVAGSSSINQAPITGESVPVDKRATDEPAADLARFEHARPEHRVFAGTINGAGVLEVMVARPAGQSTLARVMQMVTDAEAQRSPTQRFTERFEKVFVPCVFVLAGSLLLAWVVIDEPFSASFYRAMAVLVAASPCALAISAPSAVLSGVARAARSGVLIKGGAALENLGTLTAIAFDKTGTLTEGKPRLTDVITADESTEPELLRVALAVEQHSDHPLATAIVDGARLRLGAENSVSPANAIESLTGRGIKALVDGVEVYIGKPILFDEISGSPPPPNVSAANVQLVAAGRTTMIVRWGTRYLGVLGVMDTPRPQAEKVMHRLRAVGIKRLIMISGDNQRVAEAIAKHVGLTDAKGDLLPEQKVEMFEALRQEAGKVAMVGDGVNDAPAMAHATVGIAMGAAGSDVALETADVALMADDLAKLPFAVELSRRASGIIRQNLWVSLGVVAMLIPATMFGLNIGTAVLFHEGSTLLVVANALRLLAFTATSEADA